MLKTQIYLGLAIICILGVLSMLYIYRSLDHVADYLSTLDNVGVPFSIAALEMEKNAGEFADGVLRFIHDPNPAIRTEAMHDLEDFHERQAIYMQLSTTQRERALGNKVILGHQQLTRAGMALMDQRDALDSIFHQTTLILERIDELADGKMTPAAGSGGVDRNEQLAAITNLEAETAEVGFWLTLFKHRPTEDNKRMLLDKIAEQHNAMAAYGKLPLQGEQQHLAQAATQLHRQVARNVNDLLAGEIDLDLRTAAFSEQIEQLDQVFDNQIQNMLLTGLAQPQENADAAIDSVKATMRYLIPLYFLIAGGIGVWLILAIMRPLHRLSEGTKIIGDGDLSYRIDDSGGDEFSRLAHQFNLMVTRLRESTVSRESLEASQQELRQTVAELRQEIHERQQAERAQRELQGQLQRSETLAAMGRLVGGVAHEVRNPLFGISSTLDAMEAAGDESNASTFHEVLRREVKRLNKLMSELLDYGRQSGSELHPGHIAPVIAEAIDHCRTTATTAGVMLLAAIEHNPSLPMDHDRLLQVFVNLIDNAVQHAPADSEVRIETRLLQSDGQAWLMCQVVDSGPGFDDADLPDLFTPFFSRRRGGTGLGLAIVQRIVDEHHGFIMASNRPQGGACIHLRLPLDHGAPTVAQQVATNPPRA